MLTERSVISVNAIESIAVRADSIGAGHGNTLVLHGVSVAFAKGRWTSIVGPNGAGKSTLLLVLAGLLPHTGQVHLLGQPLASWSARQRAQQVAWLGQNQTGGDDLTAYDVALLGRLPHRPWLAAPSPADHAATMQALQATRAWGFRQRLLGHLSGGERQRVLLARALAVQAQVFLMDEPLTNLDPPHQADWMVLVRELVTQGKTVVSVLHEISIALQADDMLILNKGRVLHQGACTNVDTHQALAAVFAQRVSVRRAGEQWIALVKP